MMIEDKYGSQDEFIAWADLINRELNRVEYMADFFVLKIKSIIQERLVEDKNIKHIDYMFSALDVIDLKGNIEPDYDTYGSLGVKAYSSGNYVVAEEAFRRTLHLKCDFDGKWHLAHLIRRGEVRNIERYHARDVIDLLMDGARNKKAFDMIELALFLSLNLGDEITWDIADRLISFVDSMFYGFDDAIEYWREYRYKQELEGCLVLFWMIRHGQIQDEMGSFSGLVNIIRDKLPGIPKKMLYIKTTYDERRGIEKKKLDSWA